MLVRKVAIENVRSFLDRAELMLDGPITIVIGPNGGGKTNLLDTVVIMLRRYLFASMHLCMQCIRRRRNSQTVTSSVKTTS
jgi:putative ATP-dependent endonuclease of OLD family